MTQRDWPSGKAAAFQTITGGFDSRVPLQFNGIQIVSDKPGTPQNPLFWEMPNGIASSRGDEVP